jgi:hypothetical protein
VSIDQAIAGAQYEGAPNLLAPQRSVLFLGANGRMGEQLLGELASVSDYSRVDVATVANIEMGVAKVKGRPIGQWQPVQDIVINITAEDDAFGASYYGRDAAFLKVRENEVEALIPQLVTLGVERLAIIRPMSAFSQMGGVGAALIEPYEYAAHKTSISTVLIFRPTPLVEPSVARTWAQKLFGGYMSLNRFTMPKSFEPLRSADAAHIMMQCLAEAGPGLSVFTADKLRGLLETYRSKIYK